MNDKVSVCMACYNGEKFIFEQIKSILKQLRNYDELVISDHGSTDSTLHIINGFNDDRIKIFHFKKDSIWLNYCRTNILVSQNFNNALLKSSGNFIFLSDQDDIWLPNKLNIMLNLLKANNDTLIMSSFNVINENGEIIQINNDLTKNSFVKSIIKAKFGGCTMAFDRFFLNQILPFPNFPISHDLWIGLLANYQRKLIIINKPLILYRRHSKNVTRNIKLPLWFKLIYRIYYAIKVIARIYLKF